eukprot:scaffold95688_cov15-Tisochrysis_lutea.AAC.2
MESAGQGSGHPYAVVHRWRAQLCCAAGDGAIQEGSLKERESKLQFRSVQGQAAHSAERNHGSQ